MQQQNHRLIQKRTLQLLAAGFAITFLTSTGAALAIEESEPEYATVDNRGSSQHRGGDHYDHDRKSRHGKSGKDAYRSDRRSNHDRRYGHDRHRGDRRYGHDRYRSDRRYRSDHRYRSDRRYRSDHRYRGRHNYRYDRHHGSRYGHRSGNHHYRTRHFDIPRRILRDLVHAFSDYHYGRHYYRAHNHYHEIYRFPVYYGAEVDYRPYAYCEGDYFATGVFGNDGPRFDGHGRY